MSNLTEETTALQAGSHFPKSSKCLVCTKQMISEWAGNRICLTCKEAQEDIAPLDDVDTRTVLSSMKAGAF